MAAVSESYFIIGKRDTELTSMISILNQKNLNNQVVIKGYDSAVLVYWKQDDSKTEESETVALVLLTAFGRASAIFIFVFFCPGNQAQSY